MSLRYEIEPETFAVRVFYEDSDVASLYQPNFPNGDTWASEEEATGWADLYVASIEDDSAPFAPLGRGMAGEPKPSAEKLAALRAALELLNSASTPEEREAANQALIAARNLD